MIALGAVVAGVGTGMLLPTLLTWAVNRLEFDQRGRGHRPVDRCPLHRPVLSPVLIAGIGVLAGVAVVMAGVSVLATRRNSVPLDVTND